MLFLNVISLKNVEIMRVYKIKRESMNKFSKNFKSIGFTILMVLQEQFSWFYSSFSFWECGLPSKDIPLWLSEGFVHSIINSKWVGLDNFKFLFSSKDAFVITRNTVLYNLGFIFIGLVVSVGIAIILVNFALSKWLKSTKHLCCSLTSYLGLSSVSLQMHSKYR